MIDTHEARRIFLKYFNSVLSLRTERPEVVVPYLYVPSH